MSSTRGSTPEYGTPEPGRSAVANTEQTSTLATPLSFGATRQRRARQIARTTVRMALRNKLGAAGVALVVLILAVAIFTPLVQRYGDTQVFQTTNPNFNPTANP